MQFTWRESKFCHKKLEFWSSVDCCRSLEVHNAATSAWRQYFTLGEIFKKYGNIQESILHLRHALEVTKLMNFLQLFLKLFYKLSVKSKERQSPWSSDGDWEDSNFVASCHDSSNHNSSSAWRFTRSPMLLAARRRTFIRETRQTLLQVSRQQSSSHSKEVKNFFW